MAKIFLILLSVCFIETTAYAGVEVRNGGFVTNCFRPGSNTERAWYLLDISENPNEFIVTRHDGSHAIQTSDYKVDETIGLKERLVRIGRRLAKVDSDFGEEFEFNLEDLFQTAQFVNTLPFQGADISYRFSRLKDCRHLKQAALQIWNGNYWTFKISNEMWNQLDEANRTALFVHEIIYRYFSVRLNFSSLLFRSDVPTLFESEKIQDSILSSIIERLKRSANSHH